MERRLLLLRHLKSSWDDPTLDDFDRPLSKRGMNAAAVVREQIRRTSLVPDLVVCSPAKRTVSTLERVLLPLFPSILVRFERRIYESSVADFVDVLSNMSSDVANLTFIGHNPVMEAVATRMTTADDGRDRERMLTKFPSGAAALIGLQAESWSSAVRQGGTLMSFTTPRDEVGPSA